MKIIIKSLKQVLYNVEIESDLKTIKDLKNKIEEIHSFDSYIMKLIYNGVILEDAKTLRDYNIKDENVIIMMNSKIKPKKNPPQIQSPSTVSQSKSIEVIKEEESNEIIYEKNIQFLLELGYEREKVEKALNDANGSINLAFEYLTSKNIQERDQDNSNSINTNNNSNLPIGIREYFCYIKINCQNNPNKIISSLNNLKNISPMIFYSLQQYEQDIKNYLVSPLSQEDITIYKNFNQNITNFQESFTKEERDAVKRIEELGNFNHYEVIESYFICGKNEEKTVNYLLNKNLRNEEEANKNNH